MEGLTLKVADLCPATRALGPGLRAVLWVQGCPIHCKGCIAPDWIPFEDAHILTPKDAGDRLMQNPGIGGITISGGEPMMQAEGLTAMLRYIRGKKNLHVICFTGFRYEALLKWEKSKKIVEFLGEINVLIDGPYVESMNNGQSFAGSSNQRIIELTKNSDPDPLTWTPRKMEIHIRKRDILAVGIPPNNWVRDPMSIFSSDLIQNVVEAK